MEEWNGRVMDVAHTGASGCFNELELHDHPVPPVRICGRDDGSHPSFTEFPDEEGTEIHFALEAMPDG